VADGTGGRGRDDGRESYRLTEEGRVGGVGADRDQSVVPLHDHAEVYFGLRSGVPAVGRTAEGRRDGVRTDLQGRAAWDIVEREDRLTRRIEGDHERLLRGARIHDKRDVAAREQVVVRILRGQRRRRRHGGRDGDCLPVERPGRICRRRVQVELRRVQGHVVNERVRHDAADAVALRLAEPNIAVGPARHALEAAVGADAGAEFGDGADSAGRRDARYAVAGRLGEPEIAIGAGRDVERGRCWRTGRC